MPKPTVNQSKPINFRAINTKPTQPFSSGLSSLGTVAKAPEAQVQPFKATLPTNQIKNTQAPTQSIEERTNALKANNASQAVGQPQNAAQALASSTGANTGSQGGYSAPVNPANTENNSTYQWQTPAQQSATSAGATQGYQAPANSGMFGQLIAQQANTATQGSPIASQAAQGLMQTAQNNPLEKGQAYSNYNAAVQRLQEIRNNASQARQNLGLSGGDFHFAQGRQQLAQQFYAEQENQAQEAVNQAQAALGYGIQEQGQQQAGYQQAGSLAQGQQELAQSGLNSAASQILPQLDQYGQTYYQPLNSQGGGGSGTLQLSGAPLNDINTFAQAVANGTMSYDTALSQIQGYGTAVANQLLPAIQQMNPNFNVAQSNTLAEQQGSVGPALAYATSTLQNLKSTVGNLGAMQGTNIPGVNTIGNTFSQWTGVGSTQTREYVQAVQEARSAFSSFLASVRGGNPTQYGDQALAAIPDEPTPNDIDAAIATLESLGGSKQSIYGNPGASSTGSGSTESGSFTSSMGNTYSYPNQ